MKPIPRDPLRFETFEAFIQYGRSEKISIADPRIIDGFINGQQVSIRNALSNDAFLYGQRTQSMFEALVVSLGTVQFIKQEDSGGGYAQDDLITVPDFRVVLPDGRQWLIEVKNYAGDAFDSLVLNETYLEGSEKYASLTKADYRVAIYWVGCNEWTLTPATAFRRESGKASVSYAEAAMANVMAELGDRMIGTEFPLGISMFPRVDEPRTVGPDGKVQCRMGEVKFLSKDRVVTSEVEQRIAWYLMMYGSWEEQPPEAEIKDGLLEEIKFKWLPETYFKNREEYEKQGFGFVGSLSGMFSKYYRHRTVTDGRVEHLKIDPKPGELGRLIPEDYDYKSSTLPLWKCELRPSR